MKGGWLVKEGKCAKGPRICPICNKKIWKLHRKHKCRICGECVHKKCCIPEFLYNKAKDENDKSGPMCRSCWDTNFRGMTDNDLETGYCPKLDGVKKSTLARFPRACMLQDDFNHLVRLVSEGKLTEFKQNVGYNLKPTGPINQIEHEMIQGQEQESEIYSLYLKVKENPDDYKKVCEKWFREIMGISSNTPIEFNTNPPGNNTSVIISSKDRVYLIKYSMDIDLEIYNSIHGSNLNISAKIYNMALFRIPLECFIYLIGLESLSSESACNLNKTLNEAAYCFEFEKLVDYYDIQEEAKDKNDKVTLDKLLKSNEDLITRSSPYGTHEDHQSPGHNVCSKIVGDEIISYFIDMGDFEFIDKGSLRMKKKRRTKKKKRKKKKKGKSKGKSKGKPKGKSKGKTKRKKK